MKVFKNEGNPYFIRVSEILRNNRICQAKIRSEKKIRRSGSFVSCYSGFAVTLPSD